MDSFLKLWGQSALTSLGLFWMALWAFGFGYLISSMIQIFVTQERMKKTMGEAGLKSVALGTFFGFISSSCSFAALSTSRALFAKGAGLIPALAFLLSSTNLVIELGVVISIFLSWQFVVGEYLGGLLLILLMYLIVKLSLPKNLENEARKHASKDEEENKSKETLEWTDLIRTKKAWLKVAKKYIMEWKMVWKDVTIGFTVAGAIATFVPKAFFEFLFIGSASKNPEVYEIILQAFVGPVAAFFTFIGSMGNIPLAAVLFSNGVSFAGIMAFIFSDLVVFPVLRIQAKYYGWKMAMYIMAVFLVILISSSLILHFGFSPFDLLPDPTDVESISDRKYFKVDSTLFLNILFILFSLFCFYIFNNRKKEKMSLKGVGYGELVMLSLSGLSFLWLVIGLFIFWFKF